MFWAKFKRKKYSDCVLCGMCTAKDISILHKSDSLGMPREVLADIVESTVKKIIDEIK